MIWERGRKIKHIISFLNTRKSKADIDTKSSNTQKFIYKAHLKPKCFTVKRKRKKERLPLETFTLSAQNNKKRPSICGPKDQQLLNTWWKYKHLKSKQICSVALFYWRVSVSFFINSRKQLQRQLIFYKILGSRRTIKSSLHTIYPNTLFLLYVSLYTIYL